MKELELSQQVLHKVLQDDISFKKALKDVLFGEDNSKYIKEVSGLVGCELRHHLLFAYLVKNRINKNLSEEEKELAYLAIANSYFFKKIDGKKIKSFLEKKSSNLKDDSLLELLNYEGSPLDLIEFKKGTLDFVSIRFNTPSWLVKMWGKHYSKAVTYKILKANCKFKPQYFAVNSLHTSEDEIIAKYDGKFSKTEFKNLLKYNANDNVRHLEDFKNNNLFVINKAYKYLLNKYNNDMLNEISVYSGDDNSFVRELLIQSKLQTGINLAITDMSNRVEILRQIRIEKARNINLFVANDEISMRTGISHKQELFYVFPMSSSFDKISLYPDYLLHFKKESFDKLIANQINSLNITAPFIMEDGLLIYLVDTINKKETTNVIETFLKSHPNFELIEEKQHFSFDEYATHFYYAVLKKKSEQND